MIEPYGDFDIFSISFIIFRNIIKQLYFQVILMKSALVKLVKKASVSLSLNVRIDSQVTVQWRTDKLTAFRTVIFK